MKEERVSGKDFFHRTEGQSIVIVALALLVLVAVAGLGLDGANAFNQRRNTVNAADAAAMAGTRALIDVQRSSAAASTICQAAQTYLNQHGLDQGTSGSSFPWQAYYADRFGNRGAQACNGNSLVSNPSSTAKGIAIDVQYTFNTLLMTVLNRNDLTVDASATAIYGPLGSTIGENLIPVTISQDAADDIMDPANSGGFVFGSNTGFFQVQAGNFGSVSFDPDGSNQTGNFGQDCEVDSPDDASHPDSQTYWWCQGSQYPIDIGDTLHAQTGTIANSLADEIQWRITNKPIALVPVFSYSTGPGNNAIVTIVGFLPIQLTGYNVTGPNDSRWISATYDSSNPMITSGSINSNGLDTGVYAINLVR
jgi:Flp pilus assembly protein TadG